MTRPRPWRFLESETLQDCRVFSVARSTMESPETGEPHPFYTIDSAEWVNVVAVTAADELVMVRQFRHGARAITLELPGGLVDPGESPAQSAARELLEETGYASDEVLRLGDTNPNPALFRNRCHTFLAPNARCVAEIKNPGHEETVVELVAWEAVREKVRAGEIDHALIVAALYLYELTSR